jgi:predicted acylesterase/phospholipase RssA
MRVASRPFIVVALLAWVWGATFLQVGGSPAIVAWLVTFSITIAFSVYRPFFRSRLAWVWAFSATFLVFLAFVGTRNLARDVACVALALIVSVTLSRRHARRGTDVERVSNWRWYVSAVLTFWISFSGLDRLLQALALRKEISQQEVAQQRSSPQQVKTAVALSGGGYRAALMHAGVLDALEKILPITHLVSVSGGSIVGAYYATGGRPAQFAQIVKSGRLNFRRELLNVVNAPRLPLPLRIPGTRVQLLPFADFDRTRVQVDLLDRVLFGGKTLRDLSAPDRPRLVIGATELLTGSAYGFGSEGAFEIPLLHPALKQPFVNRPRIEAFSSACAGCRIGNPTDRPVRLATVVGASGAFPGAFSAIREAVDVRDTPAAPLPPGISPPKFYTELVLTDGGLVDNSALLFLTGASNRSADWNVDLVISSDAGAVFAAASSVDPLTEFARAIDVMHANATALPVVPPRLPGPMILVSPALFGSPAGQLNTIGLQIAAKVDEAIPQDGSLTLFDDIFSSDPQLHGAFRSLQLAADGTARINARSRFVEQLAQEIHWEVTTFHLTSTLNDQFEPGEVDRLFRLGQHLVVLNWKTLAGHVQSVPYR